MNVTELDISKYSEMIIMSAIIGQIPAVLGELLNLIPQIFQYLCGLIMRFIEYLFRKREHKYKYSKNYNQELTFRRIGDHTSNLDVSESMSPIIGLYLKYISNIDYARNNNLNDVIYNYIPYRNNTYKIPTIHDPVEIDDGVFIYYTIESSNNERNHNDMFSISTQTLHICISLLSNISKSILENFEKRMEKENEDHRYIIDNYQTISYLDLKEANNPKWKTYSFNTTKSFDNIFLPEKEQIYRVLDTFVNNKDLYCRLGKQYYLGMLLYGLPGCGKTSLIKAIANFTKRDIYVLKLSDIKTNSDLEYVFKDENIHIESYIPHIDSDFYTRPFNKRIIIIEDADVDIKMIEDRKISSENQKKDKEVTEKLKTNLVSMLDENKPMDATAIGNIANLLMKGTKDEVIGPLRTPKTFDLDVFLNILDGIQEQDGTIFIMTTNYPEKIDKALIRPGRCDIRVEFKYTTAETILEMVKYYYKEDYVETDFVVDDKNCLASLANFCVKVDGKCLPVLENMGNKWTASEICQILYENSYKEFCGKMRAGTISRD